MPKSFQNGRRKTARSVVGKTGVGFDVFARDSKGREYDIEIQRADKGAAPRRCQKTG